MKDVSGSLRYRYTYDTLGRLIGSSMKSGSTVALQTQHQYDDANRLSKQVWALPGKTYQENYVYDEDNGRLTAKTITLPSSQTANIALGYDDLSRVNSTTSPAATTDYAYAAAQQGSGTTGLVSAYTVTPTQPSSNGFNPFFITYSYDPLGNITQEDISLQEGVLLDRRSYVYDNQSQLTQAASTE